MDCTAIRYPKRPQYFACWFVRLLFKTCAANVIGPDGVLLLTRVAMTEDALRYQRPVTFLNQQLMNELRIRTWERLNRSRNACIEAGWLNYTPPPKGTRKAGTYFVTVPPDAVGLSDSPIDEGDHTPDHTPDYIRKPDMVSDTVRGNSLPIPIPIPSGSGTGSEPRTDHRIQFFQKHHLEDLEAQPVEPKPAGKLGGTSVFAALEPRHLTPEGNWHWLRTWHAQQLSGREPVMAGTKADLAVAIAAAMAATTRRDLQKPVGWFCKVVQKPEQWAKALGRYLPDAAGVVRDLNGEA